MIKIAVMGFGTIGSGVVDVVENNAAVLTAKVGEPVEVKYVLDIREFEGHPIHDKIVHDYKTIAADPEVAIVVETMGGVEPAFTFVKAMLEAGKGVTTSNKALVAAKGPELFAIAKANNTSFLYEASVGGGIPLLRPLYNALTADVIEEIAGILNGTTNYMLTKMSTEQKEYADVLATAQALGYAERDPSADVEGYDACRKISILTSLVSGKLVDYQEVPTEGITGITAADMQCADALGCKIKLIGQSKKVGDCYSVMVAPFLVSPGEPLFGVDDVFNGVMVHGNMVDDVMFYGRGAGKLPTASAVVGDVVELAKNIGKHIPMSWTDEKLELINPEMLENRYMVRTSADAAKVQEVFGESKIVEVPGLDALVFVTKAMTGKEMKEKAAALNAEVRTLRMH